MVPAASEAENCSRVFRVSRVPRGLQTSALLFLDAPRHKYSLIQSLDVRATGPELYRRSRHQVDRYLKIKTART